MATDQERKLERLQDFVDPRLCQSTEGSPTWLRDLATGASNDWGTLALLGRAGIRVATARDGRPVKAKPDPADILLAGLAGR